MGRRVPEEEGGHGFGLFDIFYNGMLTSAFISFALAQLAKPFTDWYCPPMSGVVVRCPAAFSPTTLLASLHDSGNHDLKLQQPSRHVVNDHCPASLCVYIMPGPCRRFAHIADSKSLAQLSVVNLIMCRVESKRWDWKRSFGSGGMPSSHTSTIAGLTTAVAVHSGLESNAFAICAVLLLVVAYDATGVRREAGKHAALLNSLMNDRPSSAQDGVLRPAQELLKVHLGHTPLQVAAGGVLGVLVGLVVQSQYGRASAAAAAALAPGHDA